MQATQLISTANATGNMPQHVAIIMDGNSRWAKANNKPVREGHRQGSNALKKLVEDCKELGLDYLTVYAFSSENWNRPKDEVIDLMDLLRYYLRHEVKSLHKNNIKLRFIGNRHALSADIQNELERSEALTQNNSALTLVIALSYGSKQEMLQATQQLAQQVAAGKLKPEDINEQHFTAQLDTANIPDPDLLIRTAGERRLSNFLLWQTAYTELYFDDVLWPDYTIEHLQTAIKCYGQRERRYGAR